VPQIAIPDWIYIFLLNLIDAFFFSVSGLQLKDITKNAQSNQWDHGKGKVYGGW
jgi:hypothetical protein